MVVAANRKGQASTKTTSWTRFKKNFSTHKYIYLLMLPGLLTLFIFRYIPMAGIVVAFQNYRVVDGLFGSEWVGLHWFEMLFSNPQFLRILGNTITITLMRLVIGFPAPIILALLINEISRNTYKRTVQTIVYLPHFISWVVIGGIMTILLSPTVGILSVFGVDRNPLLNPATFRWVVVFSGIWKDAGWGTIVYLAAISTVNPDLYEAAVVDGANRFKRVIHITLPSISGAIAVMLILNTGTLLTAGFDQLFVLQSPAVMHVGDVLDTFVYRHGLAQGRFSHAAAAGLFQAVVGLMLVTMSNYFAKRMGESGIF